MIERIKNILFSPKTEWGKIKSEQTDTIKLLTGYALPLVIVATICMVIGRIVGYFFVPAIITFLRPSFAGLFIGAIVGGIFYLVLMLAGIFIDGLVINALAPSFDSKQNNINALKLVVYSITPMLVASVLYLLLYIPFLGILAGLVVFAAGVYSLYILYLGIPILMETPAEKQVVYFIVSLVIIAVVYLIVAGVSGVIIGLVAHPRVMIP